MIIPPPTEEAADVAEVLASYAAERVR